MTALTPRERDVLALVAAGHSNNSIATQLGVGVRTVECHTGRIFMKLDIADDDGLHRRVVAALRYIASQ